MHHLIVAHEVTNIGHDRGQLSSMAGLAKAEMGVEALHVRADRGYFSGGRSWRAARSAPRPTCPNP